MTKKIKNLTICILLLSFSFITSGTLDFHELRDSQQQYTNIYEDSWPMFGNNLKRSGFSNSSAPNTNTVLWSYTPKQDIWFAQSSPAVVKNKVFIGASEIIGLFPTFGRVYCLDGFTGEVIWSIQTYDWVVSSPAVYNDKVYVGSLFVGNVYCLDAETGDKIWNYKTSNHMFSSPAVYNDKVYVGCGISVDSAGKIICLNATTGESIWEKHTPNGGVYSSPAISNNRVYVGSLDGKVYCLDAETGDEIWTYDTGSTVHSSPAVKYEKIYIGSSGNRRFYCLDAETGEEIWTYLTGDKIMSSPAVADEKVYIGSYDNKIYCLDAFTGEHIWNYSAPSKIFPSPAIADEKIYFGCGSSIDGGGSFICLNAKTGESIWNLSISTIAASSPAIVNGKLYISAHDGSLYSFSDYLPPAKPGRPTGPVTGKINNVYNYSTSTTDPNQEMVRYGWDWNNDKIVDEWTSFYPSGVTVTTPHTWQETGVHIVRVRAENTVGIQSEWSNPLVIIMPYNNNEFQNQHNSRTTLHIHNALSR
jgi:eukaryotic-like serine/threonine-protein kinase